MVWLAAALYVVEHVALPPTRGTAEQPEIGEPPSSKVTVPVGVPEPRPPAKSVALKVTDWPVTLGLWFEVSETTTVSAPTENEPLATCASGVGFSLSVAVSTHPTPTALNLT